MQIFHLSEVGLTGKREGKLTFIEHLLRARSQANHLPSIFSFKGLTSPLVNPLKKGVSLSLHTWETETKKVETPLT